jgi:hypothetical protein
MKSDERRTLWVDRVRDRRSYAILAQNFSVQNGAQAKTTGKPLPGKKTGRGFLFCFSSLAERLAAARSGQGRAAFVARRERTLDGEERGETIGEGGKKELILNLHAVDHDGGPR